MDTSQIDLTRAVKLSEFFYSIQGEGTHSGCPCTFVRLAECNLRCTWCDSKFSFRTSLVVPMGAILEEIERTGCRMVQLTGGEPLLQRAVVEDLSALLLEQGYTVLLETTLAMDLTGLDSRIVKVVDIKCPDSGMADRMDFEQIAELGPSDEVKFVIATRRDFDWSLGILRDYPRLGDHPVLFSPAAGCLEGHELGEWMLEGRVRGKLQLQIHKYLQTEVTRDKQRDHLERMRQYHPDLVAAALSEGGHVADSLGVGGNV